MKHYDVLIAGGGIVGLILACLLGQQGVKVALSDKDTEATNKTFDDSVGLRVSALNIFSKATLEKIGVWDGIKNRRVCSYHQLIVWELLKRPFLGNKNINKVVFNASDVGQSFLGYFVEDWITKLALREKIENIDCVDTYFSEQFDDVELIGDQAVLKFCDGRQLSGSLLVAADGSNSKVRACAGIGSTRIGYKQQAFLASVEISKKAPGTTWQAFTPDGPMAFLPLPSINGRHHCSVVWYHNSDFITNLNKLSDEDLIKRIEESFPDELPNIIKVVDTGHFQLSKNEAWRYSKGLLALVGDAAHTINPLAGQGVNLGIRDVAILADMLFSEKLKDVPDYKEMLNRYEIIQKPVNRRMQLLMDGFYFTFSSKNKVVQALRNMGLFSANRLVWAKKEVMKYAMGVNQK